MDHLYHYYPRVTNDNDDDDARRPEEEEKDNFKAGEPDFRTSEDSEEEAGEEFDADLDLGEEEE